jgi:hypothetical protein
MTHTGESEPAVDPDDALIDALARGHTHDRAAASAGLSRSTVTRRMRDESFRKRVSDARKLILESAASALADSMHGAIECLKRLMDNSESEMTQLGAARAILQMLLPIRQQFDLVARIEELEARR